MIKFSEPVIGIEEKKLVKKTVNQGWISSQGNIVRSFENNFSKLHNNRYALSTSNCTTALHLALLSLNIGNGDEVICTNLTFIAPANMIELSGAKLVLVDIDKSSLSMDIKEIEKKITKRTKAILVVHAFGFPAKIKKIIKIAKKYNLKIIEDVAEAIGAKINKKLCGTFGDVSCFSFFSNKIITTGEGGMLLIKKKNVYNKAKLLRDHGMSENRKYYHKFLAFNYRMTSMQAALGIAQLKKLNIILKKKNKLKCFYEKNLSKKNFTIFPLKKNKDAIEWFITIILNNKNLRKKFIQHMFKKKIECRPMIFPVSFANHFRKKFKSFHFPNTYDISLKSVHLPSSINLTTKKLKYICKTINTWDKTV